MIFVFVCLIALLGTDKASSVATFEKTLIQQKYYNGYCEQNPNDQEYAYSDTEGVGYISGAYALGVNNAANRQLCYEYCVETYGEKYYQILVYTSGTYQGNCYCSIPYSTENCGGAILDPDDAENWIFTETYRVIQSDRRKPVNATPLIGNACDSALTDTNRGPDCTPYASNAASETYVTYENKIISVPGCSTLSLPLLNRFSGVLTSTCSGGLPSNQIPSLFSDWRCTIQPFYFSSFNYGEAFETGAVDPNSAKRHVICEQCQNGTFYRVDDPFPGNPLFDKNTFDNKGIYVYGYGKCIPCDRGEFQDETAHTLEYCKSCPEGKYTPDYMMDDCEQVV